jgi:P27 family predicted phage terminase small subunit
MTGKRGFCTQPEAIAKKKGTYRKDRYKKETTKLEGLEYLDHVPEPPEHLNKVGIEFWNTNLESLIQIENLIATIDLYLFADLCYLWQSMAECTDKIKEFGLMVTDNKGKVRESIYYKTYIRMNKTFLELSRHFGMTPSSRSNMNFEPQKTELIKDPLEGFKL